ncbi:universal stress protein [Actinobacteria bacterium YIM 96077]|uniref:Universal stress protein n=1 Tax=Phytoactinopolyspora halophila TaxID=1981511 RepID=A0A329QN71_9ACTN|nr:universal stress protein [Phytoactinopolyspora halophila]AYY12279.1 universal stress protein [Actinobacteria bacterium YIM 96077]RAW13804.1 universal stress protein [Phytoactinopolyspora halophila]
MAIVVGLSDSPLGQRAMRRAAEEAVLRDLPVVLVSHVAMPRNENDAGRYRQRREEAEAQLDRAVRQLREEGVRAQTYLPSGPSDAADAILAAAEEHAASLIVVGLRRRSPVGKVFLGSTAQDVLLGADCAVLGVKLPRDEEDAD